MSDTNMETAPPPAERGEGEASNNYGSPAKTAAEKVAWSVVKDRGWKVFPVWQVVESGPPPEGYPKVPGSHYTCACKDGIKCEAPGKHPRGLWNGVNGASNDPATVAEWFNRYPDANYAVACGPESGVFVIDVDPRNEGHASLLHYEETNPLPSTLKSNTGGGGYHLFFAYPNGDEVRNRPNWLPGVDVKSGGGYVILPGSKHVSGGIYAWANDQSVIECPPEVVGNIARGRSGGLNGSDLPSTSDILSGVPEGERDNTLFRAACRWRRQMETKRDSAYDAVLALALHAAANCSPPFPEDQARKCVDSAYAQDHEDLAAIYDNVGIHPFNDRGLAARFVDLHKDKVRYVAATNRWYVWNGTYWFHDPLGTGSSVLIRWAQDVGDFIQREALLYTDSKEQAKILKEADRAGNTRTIEALLKQAKAHPDIQATPEVFAGEDDKIVCRNAIVSLTEVREDGWPKTWPLANSDGSPAHWSAACAPTDWVEIDPDDPEGAEYDDLVQQLLTDMYPDPDERDLVHRAYGYGITGFVREECMLIQQGPTASGKSTLSRPVFATLGPGYAGMAANELLIKSRSKHTSTLAAVVEKRLVFVSETNEGDHFDGQLVKQLTGGDAINARRMYEMSFDYTPHLFPILITNHLPSLQGLDPAIARRLLITATERTISPQDQDPMLKENLTTDAGREAILRWLVFGAHKWHRKFLDAKDTRTSERWDDLTDDQKKEFRITGLGHTDTTRARLQQYGIDNREAWREWLDHATDEGLLVITGDHADKTRGPDLWNAVLAYHGQRDLPGRTAFLAAIKALDSRVGRNSRGVFTGIMYLPTTVTTAPGWS